MTLELLLSYQHACSPIASVMANPCPSVRSARGINGKLDAVTEVVGGTASDVGSLKSRVDSIDQGLSHVEADVKVIKAVVTDQSRTVANHEGRIVKLDHAA